MQADAFFIHGLKHRAYVNREWLLHFFSVTDTALETEYEGSIRRTAEGVEGRVNGAWVRIDSIAPNEAIAYMRSRLTLPAGTLANQPKAVETTYGRALVNQMVICEAFGNKVPFQEGVIDPGKLEKLIARQMKDDDDPKLKPTDITVSEYIRFADIASTMAGLSTLCVASATPRSMTTDPEVIRRRDELVKAAGETIHDPVVQARINAELVEIDKKWIKGDDAEGFYIKEKSYHNTRKMMYMNQGSPTGFGERGKYIPTSLREGWNIENLPSMSNAMRDGSFNRGASTADGGVIAKLNYRIFQNSSITEEDCGSRVGIPITLTQSELSGYYSSSYITANGVVEITEENAKSLVGKPILLRSPGYCKVDGGNYCMTCFGKQYTDHRNALGTAAASVGSAFLAASLAQFHNTAKVLVTFDVKEIIQ